MGEVFKAAPISVSKQSRTPLVPTVPPPEDEFSGARKSLPASGFNCHKNSRQEIVQNPDYRSSAASALPFFLPNILTEAI